MGVRHDKSHYQAIARQAKKLGLIDKVPRSFDKSDKSKLTRLANKFATELKYIDQYRAVKTTDKLARGVRAIGWQAYKDRIIVKVKDKDDRAKFDAEKQAIVIRSQDKTTVKNRTIHLTGNLDNVKQNELVRMSVAGKPGSTQFMRVEDYIAYIERYEIIKNAPMVNDGLGLLPESLTIKARGEKRAKKKRNR